MKKIILAGGCFWGVEAYFKQLKGVVRTKVGYIDGDKKDPTYEEICNGQQTHAEAVEIFYNDNETSLNTLLEHYFRIIDPTSINKQGPDIGVQYRTGIYYENQYDQHVITNYLIDEQKKHSLPLAVEVKPESYFSQAEEYHQDYLTKNPGGYCHVDLGLIKDNERK